MALSADNGISFSQLFTVTDQPWDTAVDAPLGSRKPESHILSASTSARRKQHRLLSLMDRYSDWGSGTVDDIMPQKACAFIVERSTFGQDEIDARRKDVPGHHAVVSDAFLTRMRITAEKEVAPLFLGVELSLVNHFVVWYYLRVVS
jgi:hypothetical protein